MLVIVSDRAVGFLMEAFTGIIRGILTNISVDVLVGVTVNIFLVEITAFEFAMSSPLE